MRPAPDPAVKTSFAFLQAWEHRTAGSMLRVTNEACDVRR